MWSKALFVSVIGLSLAHSAGAQVLDRPERESAREQRVTGADPTRSELTLDLNMLAGYGDDIWNEQLTPVDSVSGDSIYTSQGSATLRFFRGRAARSFTVAGNALVDTSSQSFDPVAGGGVDVAAMSQVGRDGLLTVSGNVNYQPFLMVVPFAGTPGDGEPALPPNTAYGFTESGSVTLGATSTFIKDWSRGNRSAAAYRFVKRDQHDAGYDGASNAASFSQAKGLGRVVSVLGDYEFENQDLTAGVSEDLPLRTHTFRGGVNVRRRVSRTRTFSLGLHAGSSYVDAYDFATQARFSRWAPTTAVDFSIDLGRSWSTRVDYNRGTDVLAAISREAFTSDTGSLSVGGQLSQRLELVFTATASRGIGEGIGESAADYSMSALTGQLRWSFERWGSVIVNYSHYQHDVHDVSDPSIPYPAAFNRDAIRVGYSLRLPLMGQQPGRRRSGIGSGA